MEEGREKRRKEGRSVSREHVQNHFLKGVLGSLGLATLYYMRLQVLFSRTAGQNS